MASFLHQEVEPNWEVSTWSHRAWLTSGCITVLISLAKSIASTTTLRTWLELISSAVFGYLLADPATGFYHWAIDNYGDEKTPIFGSQIESFQGHHQQPWAITKRQFANNLYIPAACITLAVFPVNLFCKDPVLLGFVGVFSSCIMFSQLFHAWAHTSKAKLPPLVVALQDAGLLVGRVPHARHHRPPYNNNYCIVSGLWNRFLDKAKVFLAFEVVLFHVLGVRPRSWADPNSEWVEKTEYYGKNE